MSINFHVRRVNARALAALRRDPTLTSALCDPYVDFDPEDFERELLANTPPADHQARRLRFEFRRNRAIDERDAARLALRTGGIETRDIGLALNLESSWWGMPAMIGAPTGRRLIAEAEGKPLGEDFGYRPPTSSPRANSRPSSPTSKP